MRIDKHGKTIEVAVTFGKNASLVGILHKPPHRRSTSVLFLPGDPDLAAGPYRLYVNAARALGKRGYPCLRFDYAGRGDSLDSEPTNPVRDCLAAVDFLKAELGSDHVMAIGQCVGGLTATLAATRYGAVFRAIVLWSPAPFGASARDGWVRSMGIIAGKFADFFAEPRTAFSHLAAKQYRLGEIWGILREGVATSRSPTGYCRETKRKHLGSSLKGQNVLGVVGMRDPNCQISLHGYETLFGKRGADFEMACVPEGDHTFQSAESQTQLIALTTEWIESLTDDPYVAT